MKNAVENLIFILTTIIACKIVMLEQVCINSLYLTERRVWQKK
jgi:hypothetical protein